MFFSLSPKAGLHVALQLVKTLNITLFFQLTIEKIHNLKNKSFFIFRLPAIL